MQTIKLSIEKNGFTGTYYPASVPTNKAMIVLLGNNGHNLLVKSAAKWLHTQKCNVMGIGSMQKANDERGYHNFPLECIETATKWLFAQGNKKVGITGGSITGMVCLVAASYIPDISLVIAGTPCDFVMQGFYKGKKDGMREWPAENQAAVAYRGETLPFQSYHRTAREYWDTMQSASKKHKEINALDIFRYCEKVKPISEEAYIKVENIKGKILLFAAKDDSLWDTHKYCERIKQRLKDKDFSYPLECNIYEHGTHFVFPDGMMNAVLPFGNILLPKLFAAGRRFPKECKATRKSIEQITKAALHNW